MIWMDDVVRQMNTSEKPRDVSGVELLMNNHQSLKAEIDTREDNLLSCINLGKDLLSRNHYASDKITEKLTALTNHRNALLHRWEERWENLQLSKFFHYYLLIYLYAYFCNMRLYISIIFNTNKAICYLQFWKYTNSQEMLLLRKPG